MLASSRAVPAVGILVLLLAANGALQAEVIEEIVAKVNDDIITKTDLEAEEQSLTAEMYRAHAGQELDEKLRAAKGQLLKRMIDRKILVQRAERLFDVERMERTYLDSFLEQQKIKDEQELERLLAKEGTTLADFTRRLVEFSAPEAVIRYEVGDRIAVGDKELEAYYAAHPEEVTVPGEVTLREIVLLADEERRPARRTEAEAIRQRAVAPGTDFAALAKEASESGTRDSGGLLGPLRREEVASQIQQQAFSLPVGAIGEVIEAPYGYHIIKVEGRTDTRVKPLDEVRESLRAGIAEQKYQADLSGYLERAWRESSVWVNPKYAARLQAGS